MEWAEAISEAVRFMESHITEDITVNEVAEHVHISPFYFHRGFSMLCGLSVAEYIRSRRMSLAGEELMTGKATIMMLAVKYGYDSADSFSKAFYRFHGILPQTARKEKRMLKNFAPMKLTISMKGGYLMDYKIVKKESFTVMGVEKEFSYDNAKQEVPAFEWAVFACKGALPQALQDVNVKIFSEWLPALKEYEFAAGYCVEMYDAPDKYPKGTLDENYYAELWVPVKKK